MQADATGQQHQTDATLTEKPVSQRLRPHANWLIILSALAVMPFGEAAFNIAMAVLGVLGVITLIDSPAIRRDRRVQLVMLLLGAICVPMLISLVGAVEAERSLRTTAAFLRFPLAAVFVVSAMQDSTTRRWLPIGVFAVCAVWTVDGLAQWQFGRNAMGYPYDGLSVTGLFHPKRVIGLLLAALMPVLLECAWQASRGGVLKSGQDALKSPHPIVLAIAVGAWCIVIGAVLVILLGGVRTSWMMLALGSLAWGGYRYVASPWRYKTIASIGLILAIALALPMVIRMPGLDQRVEETKQLFQLDYDSINAATSGRLPIWEIALKIWRDHPITGIGPRGFRYLYPEYADDQTPWISPDGQTGAAHPHQTVLEILVETGLIGLAGFAIFWAVLSLAAVRYGNERAAPWIIAVLVAFFPLNTHMAMYGTYWSHISWLLVMIAAALMHSRRNE